MAGLELRNGRYNVIIRFDGQRFIRSLKTTDEEEALTRLANIEETIKLVERGRIEVPEGTDVVTFLVSEGRRKQVALPARLTLSRLFERYFASIPEGNLEESTLCALRVHRRHFERLIGKRYVVQQLTREKLQSYVNARLKEKVGRSTINKELVTLRTVWGWGVDDGIVTGTFPRRGVKLPKAVDLPPFQTWQEIERQVQNGIPDEEQSKLWECLYLSMEEIEALLRDVNRLAAFPFIYPMCCLAAYIRGQRPLLPFLHLRRDKLAPAIPETGLSPVDRPERRQ